MLLRGRTLLCFYFLFYKPKRGKKNCHIELALLNNLCFFGLKAPLKQLTYMASVYVNKMAFTKKE